MKHHLACFSLIALLSVSGCSIDKDVQGAAIGTGLGVSAAVAACPDAMCGVVVTGIGTAIGYAMGDVAQKQEDRQRALVNSQSETGYYGRRREPPKDFLAEARSAEIQKQEQRDVSKRQAEKVAKAVAVNANCKEFTEEVQINGQTTSSKGVVCRNEAGDWIIQ